MVFVNETLDSTRKLPLDPQQMCSHTQVHNFQEVCESIMQCPAATYCFAYGFAYVRVTYDATQVAQERLRRKPQTTP